MRANDWTVYPAIDLREGRVVRLMQGDPDRETEYARDALHVARRWRKAGAAWVHVVSLDGAFGGRGRENLQALERILKGTREPVLTSLGPRSKGLKVQFGGGLRDSASVRRVLDMGVDRVVLGTAAVGDPALVEEALDAHGAQRIAIGIDARDGRVQTHGWREAARVAALDLADQWLGKGVRWLVFTDVARDGMRRGLNLEATVQLAERTGLHVIASGGVSSLEDVRQTYEAGLSGVIIGRALYEGQVTLENALRVDAKANQGCR